MSRKRNDLPDLYRDIPLPPDWTRVTRLEKGWSRELKFFVDTGSRQRFLLRVRDNNQQESHRNEFDFVLRLNAAGIAVPRPHLFGLTNQGQSTFMLLDWIEGQDLAEVLPGLPACDQYRLGKEAGQILRMIHHMPIREDAPPPRDIRQKSLEKVDKFEEAGLCIKDSTRVAEFIRGHIGWIGCGPFVCQHGDYHPGNLIFMPDRHIAVIDFNRWDIGDPVEEFYKLQSFTIQSSIPFARGQLDGYFDGMPDEAFWQALAVHVAVSALYSIRWAAPFGAHEVEGMVQRYNQAFLDYRGFAQIIPDWYHDTEKRPAQ